MIKLVLPNPTPPATENPEPETKNKEKEGLYSALLDTDEKRDQD